MKNSFFEGIREESTIISRIRELETAKVGLYSVGLYPASLAYNCAMQTDGDNLLIAPRPGRDLFGAFSVTSLRGMDKEHISRMLDMSIHNEGKNVVSNNLADLILRCDLVILSANSNHVEEDLNEAITLRQNLNRERVVFACLAGSFCHDNSSNESYVLCQKVPKLAFFSGFHRHDSLRNPLDSFTANFCHPEALTAMLGARILDRLSPNIQVSSGVHNIEGQYIKAAKNISSIFAGFGYTYHKDNPGLLPTLITLLLDQCLDQAAIVSISRPNRQELYNNQPFSLTELGYGVQRIEAALTKDGDMEKVRDHTFAQLTAMVADVRGSLMKPVSGPPTRNFQAGQVLGNKLREHNRCPLNMHEFIDWCESSSLKEGGLEGLKSLKFWPQILKSYSIPLHDSSMINLLYMSIYGNKKIKELVFKVLTQSRELTNYCQESVRPSHSRRFAEALNNLNDQESINLILNAIKSPKNLEVNYIHSSSSINSNSSYNQVYLKAMNLIEKSLS